MHTTATNGLAITTKSAGERSALARAERSKAMVQARYIMAVQRPRNMDAVRARLVQACQRPEFAEQAIYRKPIGKGVEGLSIRFVEEALAQMGNIWRRCETVYDDDDIRIIEVEVTDLETNVGHGVQRTFRKIVERRDGKGREILGERLNSYGDRLYIVRATENEILDVEAATVSKAVRQTGMALLPVVLKHECEAVIRKTRAQAHHRDPQAHVKQMVDSYLGLGVSVADLESLLGHPIGQTSTDELDRMANFDNAIRAGETTWAAVVAQKAEDDAASATSAHPASPVEDPRTGAPARAIDAYQKRAIKHQDELKNCQDPDRAQVIITILETLMATHGLPDLFMDDIVVAAKERLELK